MPRYNSMNYIVRFDWWHSHVQQHTIKMSLAEKTKAQS
ncbi:hypothetical protein PALB_25920 [Pseudoalteromonas luteoviolacea B = ATCC 29581]|nr:hypothetical protein PALB_25920 [Pseudoalteromonas luteoviolacea B = ATCC 29581]